jgi:hypothetical protein
VCAVLNGGLSRHHAAIQFGLAASTVVNELGPALSEGGPLRRARWAGTSQDDCLRSITSFLARRVQKGRVHIAWAGGRICRPLGTAGPEASTHAHRNRRRDDEGCAAASRLTAQIRLR